MLFLEIGAIFIGITASFWVDEWREQNQDTETFHRILGEVYYDVTLDESLWRGWAATNNLVLQYASDLALRDADLPPADTLFDRLDAIFTEYSFAPTLAGYRRLTNTALNIPVNDIQLTLDNLYGTLVAGHSALDADLSDLRALRTEHWSGTGIIPCAGMLGGQPLAPAVIERLDLANQVAPADQAIRRDGECLSRPFNQAIANQVMEDETFQIALREAINIRRNIASNVAWQRAVASDIRWRLEDYLPDIRLPISTLGILGSATSADWNVDDAIAMTRSGPNDWVLDISLLDGEVKFVANNEYTMNWGSPRPWVATGPNVGFGAGQVTLEEAFPSGTAWFNGLNIPVQAGRYRVRFDTQSREYSFESLED
jgi:hypothetical protein